MSSASVIAELARAGTVSLDFGNDRYKERRCRFRHIGHEALAMKLILTLEADPAGVRASLVEEWDDIHGTARMEPMVRLFDRDEAAVSWAQALARRRGLKQVYLTDSRQQSGRRSN